MNTKHWNTIAKMVAIGAFTSDKVDDVGRKKIGGQIVHQFMIDHVLYSVVEEERNDEGS